MAQFINPAMCEITEDLFFNDPYQIHERNYPAELEADVAALRDDAQLKLAVAALKHRFFAHAALLHGDIHSGSIRCRRQPEGHRRRVRLLRPHWLRYRHRHRQPAATTAACRASSAFAMPPPRAAAERHPPAVDHLRRALPALAAEKTRDAALAYPGYASAFLKRCGRTRSASRQRTDPPQRRTVARRGYRHYPDDAMRHECPRHYPGRALIVLAERIDSVDELLARVRQYS